MKLTAALLPFLVLSLAASAQDFSGAERSASPLSPAFQAANQALAERDFPAALKLLTPLAADNPKDARILYDLGSAQDALDQTAAAEQSYRAAIMDEIAFAEPRVALGLMLARAGRLDDAHAELVAAVSIESPDAGARLLRARALRALARIDQKTHPSEARDELIAALSLSPETPEDTLMSAELAEVAGNGKDAAEAAYRRALAAAPDDPEATASLAHLLVTEKKFSEAEALLHAGLAAHPADAPMTLQLASAFLAENKPAQALPLVESLHAASPAEPNVNHMLAELYFEQKDYLRAEPLLATLAAASPRDGNLLDLYAEALMHLHRYAEAERTLTPAVPDPTLFPSTADWGSAAYDLAFSAFQNNDPSVAIQTLQNRATVLPPSPPILFLTAIAEDKLHHLKIAVQAYKDFLTASDGAMPNEEFEAQHRLIALDHSR